MNTIRHLKTVIQFYSASQQQQVFKNYLTTSRMIRLTYRFYRLLSHVGAGHYVLAFHGLRSTAQTFPASPIQGDLIALGIAGNQQRNIEYIAHLSDIGPSYIPEARTKFQRFKNLLAAIAMIASRGGPHNLKKILRIVRRVEKKEGWIIALNVATFLFSYVTYQKAFTHNSKAIITANDFSPGPLAFRAAAETRGLIQIFTMHGQISSAYSSITFPRLNYHISCLYGKEALNAYSKSGQPTGTVFLTGFPGKSRPIQPIHKGIKKLGVALANYFDDDTQKKIEEIKALYPEAKLYIRLHPQSPRKPHFPRESNIEISLHSAIADFAEFCDMAIVGNTGAQIDLLKNGCPVVYCHGLDKLGEDDLGLAESGVIPIQKSSSLSHEYINDFFQNQWADKFRAYDECYLCSDELKFKIGRDLADKYNELIQEKLSQH